MGSPKQVTVRVVLWPTDRSHAPAPQPRTAPNPPRAALPAARTADACAAPGWGIWRGGHRCTHLIDHSPRPIPNKVTVTGLI